MPLCPEPSRKSSNLRIRTLRKRRRLPSKAQIAVEGADHLYKELRIENNLTDENGNEVRLKQGAKVDVAVEAEPEATVAKA